MDQVSWYLQSIPTRLLILIVTLKSTSKVADVAIFSRKHIVSHFSKC